jgi:hypothetical protein
MAAAQEQCADATMRLPIPPPGFPGGWRTALRPEETCRSFQNFVDALEFSYLLFEFFDPCGLHGRQTGCLTVVNIGVARPGAHRLRAIPELAGHPRHRARLGPQLAAQRPNRPHCSGFSSAL